MYGESYQESIINKTHNIENKPMQKYEINNPIKINNSIEKK